MRVFLTRRAGTGQSPVKGDPVFDPYRPDIDFAAYGDPSWASWDIEHPDTDEVVGYVVVWDANSAPPGTIDLGDPTDRTSMRSITIGRAKANAIMNTVFGQGNWTNAQRNRLQNRNGVQVIKFLNRRDTEMRASWGETVADLIDANDTE